jgi:hypothetical protein
MRLKLETVKDELNRFAVAYGWPAHCNTKQDCEMVALIYHTELEKHYTEESFNLAATIAWTKARRFPPVSDFFEGYDGKKPRTTGSMEGLV